jgi:hypothetical protein
VSNFSNSQFEDTWPYLRIERTEVSDYDVLRVNIITEAREDWWLADLIRRRHDRV